MRSAYKKPSMPQSASRPLPFSHSSPCQSAAAAPSLGLLLLLERPSRPGAVSVRLVTQALSHSRCAITGLLVAVSQLGISIISCLPQLMLAKPPLTPRDMHC